MKGPSAGGAEPSLLAVAEGTETRPLCSVCLLPGCPTFLSVCAARTSAMERRDR